MTTAVHKPEWFENWASYHFEIFPRPDWPPLDSPFWGEWFRMIEDLKCDHRFVYEASRLMFRNAPSFVGEHPKVHAEKIRYLVREAEAVSPPTFTKGRPRDQAWNQAAEANWERLPEEQRENWRVTVDQRLPILAQTPVFREGIAKGWAYKPSLMAGMPPESKSFPKRGPEQVLDEVSPFVSAVKPSESAA